MLSAIETAPPAVSPLLGRVDHYRIEASRELDPARRSALGQFMTPQPVASLIASLFSDLQGHVRILDAGAGVGSLLAAVVSEACGRSKRPTIIRATAFDIDPHLLSYLRRTLQDCKNECARGGIDFDTEIVESDFIQTAVEHLDLGLFGPRRALSFTHAILNPPYKKLSSDSMARATLRRVGVETSNLYTAFLALAVLLLEPGGELVAITPRSFCNGPYFRPFRELFLREMSLRRIHVFDSRKAAFSDDDVLQENIVIHAVKERQCDRVIISSSTGPADNGMSWRLVPFEEVVRPGDPERFIHVVVDDNGKDATGVVTGLPARLEDLGLSVSTGKVVDFRSREHLRSIPDDTTRPLIYPTHFAAGVVSWPKPGKKPNALADVPETANLWMPTGTYVLVKRLSSKEERRRIVAAVFDPALVPGEKIGFENHLNVFHRAGEGLPVNLARGLALFLNSTIVDTYFRQFNGHTQVNATDLRNLRFPSLRALERLGEQVHHTGIAQDEIDAAVNGALGVSMSELINGR